MLILDYFTYNGEPIVKFRLKYLYDYVDKFIILENLYTYSGKKKDDYYYNINRELFKEYEDKIIFIPMNSYLPTGEEYNKVVNIINYVRYIKLADSWISEIYHHHYTQKELKKLFKEPYILFVCDVDEIPKNQFYKYIKNDYNKLDNGVHLEMIYLMYGFNWKKPKLWYHPFVINDKQINNDESSSFSLSLVRHINHNIYYKNIGWHISYYLSIKDFIRKLESYSHTENDINEYKNEEYLKKCINEGLIFDNKTEKLIKTEDNELPENYKEFDKELRDKNLI